MSDKLTNSSVHDFLKDFLAYSETSILEEGKEKDDILEVAQARGYNLKDNSDLAGFKTVFTFAEKANKNRARLPKEKLLKALPGMIGKPVDIDHIRNFVVGHYIDYRYKQAEDMVVAYGVFYKSNFGDEWETAQKLFKSGKLGTSYEIWCPKSKRKYLTDGTYELTEMEIAGGGLMFKEKPAFDDAKVLELAKKHTVEHSQELVMASEKKYKEEEIISSAETATNPIVDIQLKVKDGKGGWVNENEVAKPIVASPVVPVVAPVIPKIKCANCQKEFDDVGMIAQQSEKKCPGCSAIIDKTGAVLYPPQIMNFSMSCPSCRASNWRLLKNEESSANVKCLSCSKEYKVDFEKAPDSELFKKLAFVYLGNASCLQCGTSIPFSTTSQIKVKNLVCSHCGLKFSVDISKLNRKQKIQKIEDVADLQKASAEGGNKEMDNKEELNQTPTVVVPPVEAVVPVEVIVEVPVVAEVPTVEIKAVVEPVVTAPVAEVLAIVPVVETVTPITPVVEAPIAEVPVVVEPIAELAIAAEVVVEPIIAAVVPLEDVEEEDDSEEKIKKMEMDLCKIIAKNKKYKNFFKAACKKIKEMKTAAKLNKASEDETVVIKSENEDLKAKIQLLETSAVKILERKNVLGECGKDLSEKDILDDGKFEVARVRKENEELKSKLVTASAPVSVKSEIVKSSDELAQIAKQIDTKAFSKK